MVRRFYSTGSWGYKRRTEESAMELFTLGIDLGKTTFHLVGMNQRGVVMVRKRFSRNQLLRSLPT
jgi:transposase